MEFGSACGRLRQFLSFKHKAKILAELSPLSRFVQRFHRACAYSWKEHFFMSDYKDGILDNERAKELAWARARPTSRARMFWQQHQDQADNAAEYDDDHPEAFINSLTETEYLYYTTYKAQSPGQVWQLNQDPMSGHQACSTEWALQTIIHNCHLLFHDELKQPRWLYGTEVLSCLGEGRDAG